MNKKLFRSVLLVLAVGLVAVMISCDLNGDGVSRSDRIDMFVSDLRNDRYDRLTRHMDPNIDGRNSWDGGTWRSALNAPDGAGGWELQKQSNTRVNISDSNAGGGLDDGHFTFSYVQRGDDYYFLRITHTTSGGTTTEIAPGAL